MQIYKNFSIHLKFFKEIHLSMQELRYFAPAQFFLTAPSRNKMQTGADASV